MLVEVGAQALRRPAPRLPGMSRQQRAAAALVGSVALILAASPAATAATTAYATPAYAAAPAMTAPARVAPAAAAPMQVAAPGTAAAQLQVAGPAAAARDGGPASSGAPVYRVAKGDYLGKVAERYLDDFEDYRELAALNRLGDPDRIRPGQLIKLPSEAADQGSRSHATGRLVTRAATPPSPGPATPERAERKQQAPDTAQPDGIRTPVAPTQPGDTPQPSESGSLTPVAPAQPGDTPQPSESGSLTPVAPAPKGGEHAPPGDHVTGGHPPVVTVGAASASEPDRVNRPLAVSAALAVASIVGAQIGAVLGMRRRVAVARTAGGQRVPVSPPSGLPAGRHRRD